MSAVGEARAVLCPSVEIPAWGDAEWAREAAFIALCVEDLTRFHTAEGRRRVVRYLSERFDA